MNIDTCTPTYIRRIARMRPMEVDSEPLTTVPIRSEAVVTGHNDRFHCLFENV
jgi:hypothetical protein